MTEAKRSAVSLGGDADTQACIAGAIAHAFHRKIPCEFVNAARSLLPEELGRVVDAFVLRFGL